MATRLKDIAGETGYSVQAVSFALNGGGNIKEETRTLIRKKADEMGYRPNLLVRGIQTGRSMTVGVMLLMRDEVDQRLFEAIALELNKQGYAPLTYIMKEDPSDIDHLLSLIDRRVDGVIIRAQGEFMESFPEEELSNRNIPLVCVDSIFPSMCYADFVGTDNTEGAQLAARHLLELGHKSIAIIDSNDPYAPMAARAIAFAECVRQEAPEVELGHIVLPFQNRYELTPQQLETTKHTAYFCTADYFAPGVYSVLKDNGYRIPEDISVVAFGGLKIYSILRPRLTMIHQDFETMGREAVRRLLARIESPSSSCSHGEHTQMMPDLIPGNSSAPAKR